MSEWLVILEVSDSYAQGEVNLERLPELEELLNEYEGSATGSGQTYGAALKVVGEVGPAVWEGLRVFFEAREKLDLPRWPLVRCEVYKKDDSVHPFD